LTNILITGGAGYLGSVLIEHLLVKKFNVTVYDNLLFGGDHLIHYISNDKFKFVKGDIRDSITLKNSLKRQDIIIHLAAIVGYPACGINPKLAHDVNFEGTKNILKLKDKSQTIFFASTGSNYGSLDEICTEESSLNPLTTYAKTKTKAEKLVINSNNFIAFRFATAFGSSPRMRVDLMVNDFVNKLINQKYLVVYEKNFMRTFLHVKDIARAFVHGIENIKEMKNNIYNVGNEKLNLSKLDVCNAVKKKTGGFVYFAEIGEDLDKRNYIVSYEKIKKVGFKNKYDLNYGIDELIKSICLMNFKNKYTNI
jgi:nucleoside-diphosphate-sugar epimerase